MSSEACPIEYSKCLLRYMRKFICRMNMLELDKWNGNTSVFNILHYSANNRYVYIYIEPVRYDLSGGLPTCLWLFIYQDYSVICISKKTHVNLIWYLYIFLLNKLCLSLSLGLNRLVIWAILTQMHHIIKKFQTRVAIHLVMKLCDEVISDGVL